LAAAELVAAIVTAAEVEAVDVELEEVAGADDEAVLASSFLFFLTMNTTNNLPSGAAREAKSPVPSTITLPPTIRTTCEASTLSWVASLAASSPNVPAKPPSSTAAPVAAFLAVTSTVVIATVPIWDDMRGSLL
jgi:hypothetical protein